MAIINLFLLTGPEEGARSPDPAVSHTQVLSFHVVLSYSHGICVYTNIKMYIPRSRDYRCTLGPLQKANTITSGHDFPRLHSCSSLYVAAQHNDLLRSAPACGTAAAAPGPESLHETTTKKDKIEFLFGSNPRVTLPWCLP